MALNDKERGEEENLLLEILGKKVKVHF